MNNPLYSDEGYEYKPPQFDTRHFSLDADGDGDVDIRDFERTARQDEQDIQYEAAKDRIFEAEADPRDNIRELKKLRASDVLTERKRRREEALADHILDEERRRLAEENRSPLAKGLSSVGKAVKGFMAKDTAPPYNQRRQPVRQQAAPRRGRQYVPVTAPPRESQIDAFAGSLLGLGHQQPDPAPAQPYRPRERPRVRYEQAPAPAPVDPLASFAHGVMGRHPVEPVRDNVYARRLAPARTQAQARVAPAPRQDRVAGFSQNVLFGGSAPKRQNSATFAKSILGAPKKSGKKKRMY